MSKIKPPRIPPGEELKVTIANQEKQISLLLDRCEGLRKERDDLGKKVSFQMGDIARLEDEVGRLTLVSQQMEQAHVRMEGWRDCAREIIGSVEMPFPLPA